MLVTLYIAVQVVAHAAIILFLPVIPFIMAGINFVARYRYGKEIHRARLMRQELPEPVKLLGRWHWRLIGAELVLFLLCPSLIWAGRLLRDRVGDAYSFGLFVQP